MNCANHSEAPAVAFCRTCGKPLCSVCSRDVRGVMFCEECLASHISAVVSPGAGIVPPAEPLPNAPSPTLAFILGWIPGVGAMYNGEFAKGFVHVLIFATLIWLVSGNVSGGLAAIVGICIGAFSIYMPIEAYKTAKARQMGLPAPDPFGFNAMFSSNPSANRAAVNPTAVVPGQPGVAVPPQVPVEEEPRSRVPMGAVILIGLGVLFLLDEVGALHFDWIWRFWPLILIALGVRILMKRQRGGSC